MWKKRINYTKEDMGFDDYEYVNEDGITIRVNHGRMQGYPGSNSVTVLGGRTYGGWLLGTPKFFKTKTEAKKFVEKAKAKINKKQYGKKVAFPY